MLRRPPTTISLTHDDIAAYEDARQAREEARASTAAEPNASANANGAQTTSENTAGGNESTEEGRRSHQVDPSDELRPFPSDRARGIRQPAGVTATPSGPSSTTAAGSPRAPARTRDERIGLTR